MSKGWVEAVDLHVPLSSRPAPGPWLRSASLRARLASLAFGVGILALCAPQTAVAAATVSRSAMARSVVSALRLPPKGLGPSYADVPSRAPEAGAVRAGADAGLWATWKPGARFRPDARATFGAALTALVRGLGGGPVAGGLPHGLERAARALGLWPSHAPKLSADLSPALLSWLCARARTASPASLRPLMASTVRSVVWQSAGSEVAAGSSMWAVPVALDAAGHAVPIPLRESATSGTLDVGAETYRAPAAGGQATLTATAPNGVRGTLRVRSVRVTVAGFDPALPRTVAAGRLIDLEVAVRAGRTVFAADNGRAVTVQAREGGDDQAQTVEDQGGYAPIRIGPFHPGVVTVSVAASGLGTRVFRVRVKATKGTGGAQTAARLASAPAPSRGARALAPFSGKGLWLPYWVWQARSPSSLLRQARTAGIRTIYLEVATSADGLYGASGLRHLLGPAHRAGVRVVAWVYADLADPGKDLANLRRVLAVRTASGERADGLALDLEGNAPLAPWALADELAAARRALGPEGSILAAVYPPGAMAPPYALVARYATAIAPMDYWHVRMTGMGYDTAYSAVSGSIREIRAQAPSSPIDVAVQAFDAFAGSGQGVYSPTAAELAGALAGARSQGAQGIGFYQWGTISPAEWAVVDRSWP